jgi:hypothetical protein
VINIEGNIADHDMDQIIEHVLGDVVTSALKLSDDKGFDRVVTQNMILKHLATHMFRLSLGTNKEAMMAGLDATFDAVNKAAMEARTGHRVS